MSSGRQPFPHLDSNQDKGFQRPVCCHYTMGEYPLRHCTIGGKLQRSALSFRVAGRLTILEISGNSPLLHGKREPISRKLIIYRPHVDSQYKTI